MREKEKFDILKKNLENMESVAIAFSGGVDSTFLVKVAYEVLGNRAIAITARSSTFPKRELNASIDFANKLGIDHIIIDSEELEIRGFENNPPNRCYLCKKELFTKITKVAKENNISYVVDGSNIDDLGDYRPGMMALKELGIVSPLKDAGLTKDEIRSLSSDYGLETWDKPAFACLSSRFPYGQKITKEKLGMVDRAEQYMLDLGFRQVRVRHHGDVARIEIPICERKKLLENENLMEDIYNTFKSIGFSYSALDLKGYRTGSMNETL